MENKDLTQLSDVETQAVLLERIKSLLEFNPEKTESCAKKLYTHYKNMNCFPKSYGTLDASIKALTNTWEKLP